MSTLIGSELDYLRCERRLNAERWLAVHPEVRGDVISVREAILAG